MQVQLRIGLCKCPVCEKFLTVEYVTFPLTPFQEDWFRCENCDMKYVGQMNDDKYEVKQYGD